MQASRPARGIQRPRYPGWFDALTVSVVLLLVFGAYVGIAHLTVVQPASDSDDALNSRDAWYFTLHGLVLAAGTVVGIILAWVVRRSAVGFALLFLAALFAAMVATQAGTFKLACEGHNDIVRHWQCNDSG
jgi:hypothetical protein